MKNKLLKIAWVLFPLLLCNGLCMQSFYAQAQTSPSSFTVSGKVTSANGEALPGVTVVLKGTTVGAATDNNGEYSLVLPNNQGTLVFSFIGFTAKEVSVNGQQTVNVSLQEDAQSLEEVVVVGYGTQEKKDLTGAVSQVKATQLENENPRSVQDVLRGNVAGLNVGYNASAKGGGDIQVRGRTSITANSSPLLVVDGVIYYGQLADINPNDIETIDVLKDASSAAVYGAKAAGGVVLITTKKGKEGKPVVTFDASFGLATMAIHEKVYDPYEFLSWREAVMLSNSTKPPTYYSNPSNLPSDVSLDTWFGYDGPAGRDPDQVWLNRLNFRPVEVANYKAGKSVNWYDMVFQHGKQQDYNVALSGQKEGVSYYMSLGYQENEGIIVGDRFETIRSRLNLEGRVNRFLSVGLNTQFSIRDESQVQADWGQIRAATPWGSEYDDKGNYRNSPNDEPGAGGRHPFLAMAYTDRLQKYTNIFSTVYGRLTLPLDITYQVNFTPRFEFYKYFNHQSSAHPDITAVGGIATRRQTETYNWQIDNLIKWKKTFNTIHEVDITLLANAEKFQSWDNTMENRGFDPSDQLGYHGIGGGILPTISSNDEYSTGDALMARIFYSLKNKYLLTLSARRDGYSAFGQRNPRATFPAAALGWIFTDESFLKSSTSWLNYGKLRLSWGINGNRDIGRYEALADLTANKYQLVDPATGLVSPITYLYVNRMANPELKWEKTTSINAGFDFGIFNNIVNGSIEAYHMSTTDLLVRRSLPNVTGFELVMDNIGEVQNKGLEFNLNTNNLNRTNFSWRTSFNFSLNRNEIVHLYGDMENITDANGNVTGQRERDDPANGWFIGRALDEIWGWNVLGVWQVDEAEEAKQYGVSPGDFKIKDVNGDLKFTNDDKEFLGFTNPRFRWTMRNEFSILKNIDFSFMMYSYWGHMNTFNQAKNRDGFPDRGSSYVVPYWTPQNPTNDFARLFSNEGGAAGFNVYRKKSFIRLDNIALAYTLPIQLIERANIQNMKIYFTTRNVGFHAPDWTFWDPENSGPTPRTYTLGLNLTL